MKIKVLVKHFIYVKDHIVRKQYDYDDSFIFTYSDGIVTKNGWQKEASTLMDAFSSITQYFNGCNYDVVDFLQMME